MKKNKKIFYTAISFIIFLLLAVIYASPILSGKKLIQADIVHYKGGAEEMLQYREQNGKETYWSDAMFGGMPTYQTGAQFNGDLIHYMDDALNLLPKPANYLFLLFAGFFLLGMVVVKNWKYALLGATFFGLSTYFYIIIAAGHNSKVHTIAYFAPLLAGILLVYIRKKYVWGFIVTALFMGLQLEANHPQMTYYLFLGLGFLFLSELLRTIKNKNHWRHFLISTGIIVLAFIFGVGMNAQRIMANAEYVKETTRGKQILTNESQTSEKSGMDKESILMWSYGKLETLNLFIPRLMGGGSQEEGSEEMMTKVQEMVQQNVSSQEEMDKISNNFSSLTYWGDQPGTSGPAYQGAVVIFLTILGFFFAHKKYRYWILSASILCLALAWGSNFLPLSDFFIDYIPLYSKFRAPSSILVVLELLFPLIAILGLYRFFNSNEKTETKPQNILTEAYKQKILVYVSSVVLGFLLILMLFGKSLLDFHTENEGQNFPPYLLNFLQDERFKMMRADAFKAFLYVAITALALYFSLKKKISQNLVLLLIGILSLIDLWSVDRNYLNNTNFADKTFADHPFITENSDFLQEKAADNVSAQNLLKQVNINKTLQEIAEKDQKHYRIYNQTLGTFSETNTSFFKSSIGGYSAVKLRRYDDVINEYFMKMDSIKVPKILNLLNTKYMIFGDPEKPQAIINPGANGNAWFVSDVKFVNNPNEEIKSIGEIDSKKTAVVNAEDKDYFNGKTLAEDSTAFLDLTKYEPNALEFKTQSKTPQLAVISEIYYPKGWTMFLDGKEVPYIKTDYFLRGVFVPAGNHVLKMTFEPSVIQKGKIVSLIAFLLFVVLSSIGIWMLFKNKKKTA